MPANVETVMSKWKYIMMKANGKRVIMLMTLWFCRQWFRSQSKFVILIWLVHIHGDLNTELFLKHTFAIVSWLKQMDLWSSLGFIQSFKFLVFTNHLEECIFINQKFQIKFKIRSTLFSHEFEFAKKGFNGPPTARSEPGRDHPC